MIQDDSGTPVPKARRWPFLLGWGAGVGLLMLALFLAQPHLPRVSPAPAIQTQTGATFNPSASPRPRYGVSTAAGVLRGMATDQFVTSGSPDWRPAWLGTPVLVRALRPGDNDVWLVPDLRPGVHGVYVVFIGSDGLGNAGQWSGGIGSGELAVPPVDESTARQLVDDPRDPVVSARLVWLRVPPIMGFYAQEDLPLWQMVRRSSTVYVTSNKSVIAAAQVDAIK